MRVLTRREVSVETAFRRWAQSVGLIVLKLNLQGSRGWPDRLVLLPGGQPLFIEFKRPGGKLETLQAYRHQLLTELGYEVVTCQNVDDAKRCTLSKLEAR